MEVEENAEVETSEEMGERLPVDEEEPVKVELD